MYDIIQRERDLTFLIREIERIDRFINNVGTRKGGGSSLLIKEKKKELKNNNNKKSFS